MRLLAKSNGTLQRYNYNFEKKCAAKLCKRDYHFRNQEQQWNPFQGLRTKQMAVPLNDEYAELEPSRVLCEFSHSIRQEAV